MKTCCTLVWQCALHVAPASLGDTAPCENASAQSEAKAPVCKPHLGISGRISQLNAALALQLAHHWIAHRDACLPSFSFLLICIFFCSFLLICIFSGSFPSF